MEQRQQQVRVPSALLLPRAEVGSAGCALDLFQFQGRAHPAVLGDYQGYTKLLGVTPRAWHRKGVCALPCESGPASVSLAWLAVVGW